MAKKSERLLKMLLDAGVDLPEGTYLERASGAWCGDNRTQGAWVWTAVGSDGIPLYRDSKGRPRMVGSQWTMTDLVRYGFETDLDNNGDLHINLPESVQLRLGDEAREQKKGLSR